MVAVGALDALPPLERHALEHLVDASALLRAGASVAGTGSLVRLQVVESSAPSLSALATSPDAAFGSAPGVVRVPDALLRLIGELISQLSDATAPRDRRGRPVSEANPLVAAGVARVAVVSRLARALADAVRGAAGDRDVLSIAPWPAGHRWAAALTHDLDVASVWPVFAALRTLELVRKGELKRAAGTVGEALRAIVRDPVRQGVEEALTAELDAIVCSTWFIICATPTVRSFREGDATYDPGSRRVRAILRDLRESRHEIALHGSFETARNGSRFVPQRERLTGLAGTGVDGVRQHFLKRQPGDTERAMAKAGFAYDSTCGFADRNGFRAGTADVFPIWDGANDVPLSLDELPFCWMDRAQSKYQGIEDPARWIDDARELAAECETVQGAWCGIWHPNLTAPLGFPGAADAYASLVRHLVDRGAWLARAGDIVRWRAGRRALRAVAFDASGDPTVHGGTVIVGNAAEPYLIVDGSGRERARVGAR